MAFDKFSGAGICARFFLAVFSVLALPAYAAEGHNQCLKAIHLASKRMGVSPKLLQKIAEVESGYGSKRQPWPWTINVKGKAYYFKNPEGALKYIEALLNAGIQSFDVGCFQINWRWHQQKVANPSVLIHPTNNALIAADYLQELYAKHQSVRQAVAHYHSADPTRGASYANRVFSRP